MTRPGWSSAAHAGTGQSTQWSEQNLEYICVHISCCLQTAAVQVKIPKAYLAQLASCELALLVPAASSVEA